MCHRSKSFCEEIMPDSDGSTLGLLGIVAVFALVAANGFFVAAEFSLVDNVVVLPADTSLGHGPAAGRPNSKDVERGIFLRVFCSDAACRPSHFPYDFGLAQNMSRYCGRLGLRN